MKKDNTNTTKKEKKERKLTPEMEKQIKQIKIDKKIYPKAYSEWRKSIRAYINTKFKDEYKALILVTLFEVAMLPIGLIVAFMYSEFQNHDYASKYKKITGFYPSGYMVPEVMMVVCVLLLGVMVYDYETNGKVQNTANGFVQALDELSPDEPGIVIAPVRVITDPLGIDYKSFSPRTTNPETIRIASDPDYKPTNKTETVTTTTTIEYDNYDNIVTSEPEVTTMEYGIGEDIREVVQ